MQAGLDLKFASDGLFCEWAWVVDLDENVFQAYRGRATCHPSQAEHKQRFAEIGNTQQGLRATFKFTELQRRTNSSEHVADDEE